MSSRSLWVDYAKAIGIVLVVYGHVARGVHSAGLSIEEGIFRKVDALIYSFHMPLFFFLSGVFFLSSLEKHGVPSTLAAKLRTVVAISSLVNIAEPGRDSTCPLYQWIGCNG